MKAKIVVIVDNGRVDEVLSTVPICVEVLETDLDNAEGSEIEFAGQKYYVYQTQMFDKPKPHQVSAIFEKIQRLRQ